MEPFDRFEPREWVAEGVLVRAPRRRAAAGSSQRRQSPWTVALAFGATISVGTVGTVLVANGRTTPLVVAEQPPPDDGRARSVGDDDVVRPGHWERVRAFVADLPAREFDDSGSDPELPDFELDA